MLKKKLFIIPALLCLIIGFTSCLDGGNSTTYPAYGVIKYDSSGKIPGRALSTSSGMVALRDSAWRAFDEGDCIFAQLEVDFDNQPSSVYTTTTLLSYERATAYYFIEDGGAIDEYYPTEISDIPVFTGSPNFYGHIMMYAHHTASSKQEFAYQLVNDPDSTYTQESTGKTIYKFYLQARAKNEEGTSKVDLYPFISFNLNSFILTNGYETEVDGVSYTTIDFDVCYINSYNEEGEPVIKQLNGTSPVVLSVYR